MKKDRDYSNWFFIGNFICFALLYIVSLMIMFKITQKVLIRVICIPILFFVCGQIELRYLILFINPFITCFLPKDIREKERLLMRQIRNREKQEKNKRKEM